MKYKDYDGKARTGHWAYDGETFESQDSMWEYTVDHCDLDDAIEDAIDERYDTAHELFREMQYGLDYESLRDNAIDDIFSDLDEPEPGEDYEIVDGITFEWVETSEFDDSPEGIELANLEERHETVEDALSYLGVHTASLKSDLVRLTDLNLFDAQGKLDSAIYLCERSKELVQSEMDFINKRMEELRKTIEERDKEPEQPQETVTPTGEGQPQI